MTNAAGGLNPDYAVGDVVVLSDVSLYVCPKPARPLLTRRVKHLNLVGLAGIHPLRGANDEEFGVRFPALSDAYDLELRRNVHHAWKKSLKHCKRNIHEGVYAFVGGPRWGRIT